MSAEDGERSDLVGIVKRPEDDGTIGGAGVERGRRGERERGSDEVRGRG